MFAPPAPQPPYAISLPTFRFRALASLAGRSSLGGGREVALAGYLVARLVDDATRGGLDAEAREARASGARSCLSTLALPAPLRAPFARLVDATAADPDAIRPPLEVVITLTAPILEAAAHSELRQLAQALAG